MRVETANGAAVNLSEHAIDQWHLRCREGKERAAAAADLLAIVAACGMVVSQRPEWMQVQEDYVEADSYLVIADVVLPVRSGVAVTCITRGGLSAAAQSVRSQARREAARARASRRGRGTQSYGGNEAFGRRGAGHRKRNKREAGPE